MNCVSLCVSSHFRTDRTETREPTILRMNDNDTKRLSRLTAILTQLQTKRLLTATNLAEKFNVSIRTIYRDIRALEQAGVPIITEDGKGYTLMDGYKIPPVMFTESQANALILAEQLVLKNKDTSFIKDYTEAIDKIKAVLRQTDKDKANLLADRTRFEQNINRERNSNNISELQQALTNFHLIKIEIDLNNEQYQIRSPEEELLLTWFDIADRETANNFLNTTQIAAKLADKAKLHVTDGMKLGKALKKYGYLRLSKKNGYVYAVKELTWEEVENKNKEKEPPPKPPEQSSISFDNP